MLDSFPASEFVLLMKFPLKSVLYTGYDSQKQYFSRTVLLLSMQKKGEKGREGGGGEVRREKERQTASQRDSVRERSTETHRERLDRERKRQRDRERARKRG